MFIGRETELQFLENRYQLEGGQLSVPTNCSLRTFPRNYFRKISLPNIISASFLTGRKLSLPY